MAEPLSVLNVRLRATREARGLSMEDLAEQAGVDQGTISRNERESRDPRMSSLTKLAKALEVSVSFLMGTEDTELDFPLALRRQSMRQFLSISANAYDDRQRRDFEELCFLDSAPNSVRGWQDLTQNYTFLQEHKSLDR